MKNCPACRREFKELADFPQVKILGYHFYDAIKKSQGYFSPSEDQEKRLTLAIQNSELFRDYLLDLKDTLRKGSYRSLNTSELMPANLEKDDYFKWANVVVKPDKRDADNWFDIVYMSFRDKESKEQQRTVELVLWVPGPNFGSAGGPTLMELGVIASIDYEGVIHGA